MPHAHTEDQLVEQRAIGLFAGLGWITVSELEELQTLRRTRDPLLPRPLSAQVACWRSTRRSQRSNW